MTESVSQDFVTFHRQIGAALISFPARARTIHHQRDDEGLFFRLDDLFTQRTQLPACGFVSLKSGKNYD